MKKILGIVIAGVALLGWMAMSASPRHAVRVAQEAQRGPEVIHSTYNDVSLPVRDYPTEAPQGLPTRERPEHPGRIIPGADVDHVDTVLQNLRLARVGAVIGLNFDGVPNTANGSLASVPPDTNSSVGSTQVVETINTAYQVYDKATGASVFGPAQISGIFTGVPGLCGQGVTSFNYTDPVVVYDKMANRWVVTILGADSSFSTGNECIAVSTSSDATGTYNRYTFAFGSNFFNDYPKFGVWPDAYYASYNLFGPTTTQADACAYNRTAMLAGQPTIAICFKNSAEFALLPTDLDGATLPPSGEPNFYVDLATGTSLHLFKFHVDFTTPTNSTFTGPTPITIAAYTMACGGGTCIPQLGTAQTLDSLGDRLMFRLAYRNFGDHEALVVSHSVKAKTTASGARWYEIRSPNATPKVFQQGTFGAASISLWMSSIAMDKVGDIALGFSESSKTLHPSIGFTGRVPTDPLNAMESMATIIQGKGSQTGATRWGDYSSMSIDPSDDCTFWYTTEYYAASSSINFNTRLASFKFPGCH